MKSKLLQVFFIFAAGGCRAAETKEHACDVPTDTGVDEVGSQASSGPGCESSCLLLGDCHAEGTSCIAQTDAECMKSRGCHTTGLCHLSGEHCRATTSLDCRNHLCDYEGACSAVGGFCRPTALDGINCVADSEEHCKHAVNCAFDGACHKLADKCAPIDDADCAGTNVCELRGECHARLGYCVPLSDEDCKSSQACKDDKRCKFDGTGSCVSP
jgi:hypothetical protein